MLKQEWIEEDFRSLTYTSMKLERRVSKKTAMTRNEWVLVVTVWPIEHTVTLLQTILPNLFVKLSEQFWIPFEMHPYFVDFVLQKIALDSGGGIIKGTINIVNVKTRKDWNM